MSLVLDTSGVIALVNAADSRHEEVVEIIAKARKRAESLLIPALVLCEIEHILEREGLESAMGPILDDILAGGYKVECPTPGDLRRAKEILADHPVGLTDATVAALAERSGRRVVTLDRRDFDRLRTSKGAKFSISP
jgi:predicted nucleic acid-binding protein